MSQPSAASSGAGPNVEHRIAYDDLREWIAEADRLGELEVVKGASWEQDIGLACTLVKYSDETPALLFDEIPGCPKGFRVLANFFGGKRKHMTLGFPSHLDKVELSDGWSAIYSDNKSDLIPPVFVDDGPVMENVMVGDDVDVLKFPSPIWHEGDGGR